MMDERLRNAITHQGSALQRRVDFLQKMLERQTQALMNYQQTIEGLRVDLQAANLALDSLRAEYRTILKEDNGKPGTELT